jgi:hypothetical protein
MAAPRKWLAGSAWVVLAMWTAGAAEGPAPVGSPEPPPRMPRADGESPGASTGLQIPPDAKAVVVPRDKYQELLDELARLREQVKAAKPVAPSFCEISGQADADLARLHIQFKLRTDKDNQRVALGCANGNPTEAKLDGQLPNFAKSGEGGFVVQVERAGEHVFALDLEVAVTGKDSQWSFSVDLPGSAVTTLELDLPDGVTAARVGPDTFKAEPAANKRNRIKGPLGPVLRLDITWTAPASGEPTPPLLLAETHVAVRVETTQVVTDAEFTLKPARDEVAEWLLQLPPQAELKKQGMDERIQSVVDGDPKGTTRIVKLNGPTGKELKIGFRVSQARVKGLIPIGPFAARGARQQGTLTISAPPEMHITYHPRGDLVHRPLTALTDEERRDPNVIAAFRFWNLPGIERPAESPSKSPPSLLDMEIEATRGEIAAGVKHELRLIRPDQGLPFWRSTTTIEGTSYWTRAEHLQVQLPAGWQFDERIGVQPADSVQGPEINPVTRLAQFSLVQKKPEAFRVVFQGSYAPLDQDERSVKLDLPQLVGVLDRGASVTISVPDECVLRPPRLPGWREAVTMEPHKQAWRYEHSPVQIDLAWEPAQTSAEPEKTIAPASLPCVERALIQVAVASSGNQAYRAWFRIRPGRSKYLDFEMPAAVSGLNFKSLVNGATTPAMAVDEDGRPIEGGWIAQIPLGAPAAMGEIVVRLEYQLPPGGTAGTGLARTLLQPPTLRGQAGWNATRWQVALPSTWLPIDAGREFRTDYRWGMRGLLPGPIPDLGWADQEGWSFGEDAKTMPPTVEGDPVASPSLVGWQTAMGPLRLTHAPQQGWLLACSLVVLALGLIVGLLQRPRVLGWGLALAACLAAASIGLAQPQWLATAMYGCGPGLAVVALVLGLQWLLHQRHRRRVMFLPGFQRAKSGSSLTRGVSSNRPRGEPSTVDAPPAPVDSKVRAAGGSSVQTAGDPRAQ